MGDEPEMQRLAVSVRLAGAIMLGMPLALVGAAIAWVKLAKQRDPR